VAYKLVAFSSGVVRKPRAEGRVYVLQAERGGVP